MNCPFCGFPIIEGADVCEKCQQPLNYLSKPQPKSDLERSILKECIRALNPRAPVAVRPDMKVGDVLNLLVERSIGCVLVVQDAQIVGIFSERDALLKLNTWAANLRDRPISEFMTEAVQTLDVGDRIAFALHKMDLGGYRHIPILDQGQISGMISIRDILRYMTNTILSA